MRLVLPQLEKTPDLYIDQFEASTQIETGPVLASDSLTLSESVSMVHGLAELRNFLAVGMFLHEPWTAV